MWCFFACKNAQKNGRVLTVRFLPISLPFKRTADCCPCMRREQGHIPLPDVQGVPALPVSVEPVQEVSAESVQAVQEVSAEPVQGHRNRTGTAEPVQAVQEVSAEPVQGHRNRTGTAESVQGAGGVCGACAGGAGGAGGVCGACAGAP